MAALAPTLEIELPALHPAQQEVRTDPHRFKILRAGRRFGKTVLAAILCLEVALGEADWHWRCHSGTPGIAWWVPPTYKQGKIGWRVLKRLAAPIAAAWPGVEILQGDYTIRFPNGGEIVIRSADSESGLRGEGLDFLVMEEAAYSPETAWVEDLRPALSDKKGQALFISTPAGVNWFAELERKVANLESWALFHYPTSANPRIDPDELAEAKLEIGPLVYAQEYEAEILEMAGKIFKADQFHRYRALGIVDGEITYRLGEETVRASELDRFITCDPALTEAEVTGKGKRTKTDPDYTAFAVWGMSPSGRFLLLHVHRVRLEAPEVLETGERLLNEWDAVWLGFESVAYQKALVQFGRRRRLPVRQLKADSDKVARALLLQARMDAGDVFFPDDAEWLPELQREMILFPHGEHDDQVDALAYGMVARAERKRWAAH